MLFEKGLKSCERVLGLCERVEGCETRLEAVCVGYELRAKLRSLLMTV